MPYSAVAVANGFLELARQDGRGIDPMKIQKLCYLAQGYHLVETGQPLFDERFEAWKFGPVLPSLYHAAKSYGRGPIRTALKDYSFEERKALAAKPPADPLVADIIRFVWDAYGDLHAMELSSWTHEKDGPWDHVMRSESTFIRNRDIPDALIADYFFRALNESASEEA